MAKEAWAVYGDYDGNCPDTSDLCVCDTEAEAEDLAAKGNAILEKDNYYENLSVEEAEIIRRLGSPVTDGWQFSLSFQVHKILVAD